MSKVIISHVGENTVHVDIAPREKPLPINIQIDQPIGLTFKLDFFKFICQSVISGLEPSITKDCGGRLVLRMPHKIEKMQKRSFFRVQVPESMQVNVMFWHRGYKDGTKAVPQSNSWQGTLIDLSGGGLQIAAGIDQKPNFKEGQLIGLQFTPMAHSKPLIIEGQIRHIAKTADEKNICLGVQIVGLEASNDGRERLKRLVETVDIYHNINQEAAANQKPVFA